MILKLLTIFVFTIIFLISLVSWKIATAGVELKQMNRNGTIWKEYEDRPMMQQYLTPKLYDF
jgi:hypothetical protein